MGKSSLSYTLFFLASPTGLFLLSRTSKKGGSVMRFELDDWSIDS